MVAAGGGDLLLFFDRGCYCDQKNQLRISILYKRHTICYNNSVGVRW